MDTNLAILFEHPTWQRPLFDALDARGVPYVAYDLKAASFGATEPPMARVVFSQASPSAYVRGNAHAVPYTIALLEHLEAMGARVLNGAGAFRLELSKIAQVRLLRSLGMNHPWTVAFNSIEGLRARAEGVTFPALLKPNQGGSGARMAVVSSFDELETLLASDPSYWEPDPVLLLQEMLDHDPEIEGIIRMEFVGDELLYAMRVRNTAGFNLCPSEDCNPSDGTEGACEIPTGVSEAGPEFLPYPDVPADAVAEGTRLFRATGFDAGGLEYLVTRDGRRVFYDMNANSNLRRPIGQAMGFDPFDRVAEYLERMVG